MILRRLPRTCTLLAALFCASCAKIPQSPEPAAAVEVSAKGPELPPPSKNPKRREAPKPAKPETPPPPPPAAAAPTPKPLPTPAPGSAAPSDTPPPRLASRTLAELIQNGTATRQPDGSLAFQPDGNPDPGSPSLFEDAILLSRLRASLKSAGAKTPTIQTARVQSGGVSLNIHAEPDARSAADAIDAVLRIPGIRRVVVGGN